MKIWPKQLLQGINLRHEVIHPRRRPKMPARFNAAAATVAGFWEDVLEGINLRPEQQSTLCLGFKQYVAKSTPLIQEMQQLVKRMQQLTGAPEAQSTAAQELVLPVQQAVQQVLADEPAAAATAAGVSGSGSARTQVLLAQQQQKEMPPPPPRHQQQQQQHESTDKALRDIEQLVGRCDLQGSSNNSSSGSGSMPAIIDSSNAEDPSNSSATAEASSSSSQQQQQQQRWSEPTSTLQTMESSAELEDIMGQLLNRVMKLREMHRQVQQRWAARALYHM
jgi:hypothetical protein